MSAEPADVAEALSDLLELGRSRPGDPLFAEYRGVADYWRRLASHVASTVGDLKVKALYFDPWGSVAGVDTRDGAHLGGGGTRWFVTRNAAMELDNRARWAEYVWARYRKDPLAVKPDGDMPDPVALTINEAKERAEAELRRRGVV